MDRWLLLPIEQRTVVRWGMVSSATVTPGRRR
jgi:hypothetical protein